MRTPATTAITIEHALLGFVYEQPMHGYEIYQRLSVPTGLWQVWRMKQSQLYALLTKLEEANYLLATLQPQEARPPRKIYSLTETGRAAFLQWLNSPITQGRQIRIEFLAKLYFAYQQAPEVPLRLIELQLAECQRWLGALQTRPTNAAGAFSTAVYQFRHSQIESFLQWLAHCRQELLNLSEQS